MLLRIFALLILLTLSGSFHAEEIDLGKSEKSFYSAYGEDGVLYKLFNLIAPTMSFCVECGAYDGFTGSNTYLLRSQGWRALLLDRSYSLPAWNLKKEYITAENINSLFDKYEVPDNFDLLSINLGYNDFYIWKALDSRYQPQVVVIEYNSVHMPDEDKVVEYHPFYVGDSTDYFGASILAMYNLAKVKDYSLVYGDSEGKKLFFVKNKVLQEYGLQFKGMNNPKKIYRTPRPENKHLRKDPRKRGHLTSAEILGIPND